MIADLLHSEAEIGDYLFKRNAFVVFEPLLGAGDGLFFLFADFFVFYRRGSQGSVHRIEEQELEETHGGGQLIGRDAV